MLGQHIKFCPWDNRQMEEGGKQANCLPQTSKKSKLKAFRSLGEQMAYQRGMGEPQEFKPHQLHAGY